MSSDLAPARSRPLWRDQRHRRAAAGGRHRRGRVLTALEPVDAATFTAAT